MSATPPRGATLRYAIAYYQTFGHMGPFAIQGGENDPPEPKPDEFPDGIGDAGKEAIRKEREARKDAERQRSEAAKELTQLRKEKADAEEARKRDADAKAIKDGEFEKLATDRAAELEATKAEAKAKADELAEAQSELAAVIAERIAALEATGDKELIAAFPKDANPLQQLRWLNDPRTKRAMASAKEADDAANAQARFKVPGTPKPNADLSKEGSDAARKAQAAHVAHSF